MKKIPKHLYVVQKLVEATSLMEALRNERKGRIVEVTLATNDVQNLKPVAGFIYKPEKDEYGTD